MERIVTVPLKDDGVVWLPESLTSLWDLTEGHPWVCQILAEQIALSLNREGRRIVLPGDVGRAADAMLAGAGVTDLWWNEEEGLVTEAHRQVALLILQKQESPRKGVPTSELFQACSRAGIRQPARYIDEMAGLELLTEEQDHWRIRGGFLERYLNGVLNRIISEKSVADAAPGTSTRSLGVFLDVENIKRSLLEMLDQLPRDRRLPCERTLQADILASRLMEAASRHGKPVVRWAVGNWEVSYLAREQKNYKQAGFQPDIAGEEKADASDHVLRERIHDALRDQDLEVFLIGTGDGDFGQIVTTLQHKGKYIVLWATRQNVSRAFGANLRSDRVQIEFLEDLVWGE